MRGRGAMAADGAAIYSSTGTNQGSFGLMVYWLQEAINAISGNLDKRGGVLAGKGVLPTPPSPDASIPPVLPPPPPHAVTNKNKAIGLKRGNDITDPNLFFKKTERPRVDVYVGVRHMVKKI